MAEITVLADRLLSCSGVAFIMTTEAAGVIGVTEIVRVCAPGDLQIREDISLVQSENLLGAAIYAVAVLAPEIRIFLLVEGRESCGDLRGGIVIARRMLP